MKSKTLLAAALAIGSTISFNAFANADDINFKACESVKQNRPQVLREMLSEYRVKLRNIYDGISCDNKPLIQASFEKNAVATGGFIARQLPVSYLNEQDVLGWAEKSGYKDSPLFESIKSRVE